MKVGLVVEDYYTGAIKEISKKIGVNPKIRAQRGRINLKKASRFVKELFSDGCIKVIILADAHCHQRGEEERLEGIYSLLTEEIRGRVHICVIRNELESWLLADEDALSKFLGRDVEVKRIADPEAIYDAKKYLIEMFKKEGKLYLTRMAKEIASSVNIDKITNKSSSFEEFRTKVIDF